MPVVAGVILLSGVQVLAQGNITLNQLAEKQKLEESFEHNVQQSRKNPENPRFVYNLGVLSYKLGRYDQSESYFRALLVDEQFHLLAKYNLGLVSYKSGDRKQAINWFKKVLSNEHGVKTSNKIKVLAKAQLAKLQAINIATNKKPASLSPFKNYIFAYLGHDDSLVDPIGNNVVVGNDFLKLYALFGINFDDSIFGKGMSWRFNYYSKDYTQFNGYDYSQFGTDLNKEFKVNNWRHNIRIGFEKSRYGATDYQSIMRLDLKSQYRMSLQKMTARYRYDSINSDDALYDFYQGDRQRLDFVYERSFKPHRLQLGLGFEDNNRLDDKTGSVVNQSYSPAHEKIYFSWFYRIDQNWKTRLKLENRDTRYNDFSISKGVTRDEAQRNYSFQLKYGLSKRWWLVANYHHTDNVSNITTYTYHRNIISAGISGSF